MSTVDLQSSRWVSILSNSKKKILKLHGVKVKFISCSPGGDTAKREDRWDPVCDKGGGEPRHVPNLTSVPKPLTSAVFTLTHNALVFKHPSCLFVDSSSTCKHPFESVHNGKHSTEERDQKGPK